MSHSLDAATMRAQNSSMVLRLVWEKRQISRAELARLTGMSRASISAIINEHITMGLVSESGTGESSGGRPPVLVNFNDDAYLLAGLDMGPTHISVALTNLRGEIKEWLTQDCKTRHDPDTALKTALDLLQQGEAAAQRRGTTMIGVGVGVSSPVYKIGHARSIHPAIHPQWQGVKLSDILEEHLSIPVFMENDANLGALAELWWQKEHKTQNLVYLKIATGLGAGIVVNGKIMPGAHGLAGEFGHTLTKTINNQDVLPHILNTKIGFEFLLQGLELQLSADDPARLTRGDLLRRAFSSAQPRGRQILNYLVDQLTPAIVNLLVLVDPELVVLGGEFPYLGHHILDRLKQMVNHHVIWPELQNIPLMLSGFGEQQTAIGGATLVLDHALADISLFREAKGRPVEVRSYASKLP